MRFLGMLATAFVTAAAAAAIVVLVRSEPDIRRYLKMRQM